MLQKTMKPSYTRCQFMGDSIGLHNKRFPALLRSCLSVRVSLLPSGKALPHENELCKSLIEVRDCITKTVAVLQIGASYGTKLLRESAPRQMCLVSCR